MSEQITELDIDAIQKRIPHRPPMLLIDRVEEIVADESAVGIKMVSVGEPFFAGLQRGRHHLAHLPVQSCPAC